MDAGILALMIPIIGVSIPVVAIWTNHKRKLVQMQIDAEAQTGGANAALYNKRVGELEDRVRVLERIVTDGGYNLASEIEALRGEREAITTPKTDVGVPLSVGSKERA